MYTSFASVAQAPVAGAVITACLAAVLGFEGWRMNVIERAFGSGLEIWRAKKMRPAGSGASNSWKPHSALPRIMRASMSKRATPTSPGTRPKSLSWTGDDCLPLWQPWQRRPTRWLANRSSARV